MAKNRNRKPKENTLDTAVEQATNTPPQITEMKHKEVNVDRRPVFVRTFTVFSNGTTETKEENIPNQRQFIWLD